MTLPSNANLPNYPFPADARSYDFEFLRMAIESILGGGSARTVQGLCDSPTDFAAAAGTGLQIVVAGGRAFVKGTDRTTQGVYHCYVPTSNTVTAQAANATNPRIDRVILHVYDADSSGSATQWEVEILTGTPTSGATLTNLSGAPTLGTNQVLLYNVLVPATFTGPFVPATHFSDQRVRVGSPITTHGKSIISTSEAKTGTTFATMPTPDRVNIYMPQDGLLMVAVHGTMQESSVGAAHVGLFVDSTQVKMWNGSSMAVVQTQARTGAANTDNVFTTINAPVNVSSVGLAVDDANNAYTGDVTTGQVMGVTICSPGPLPIFLSAGAHTVSLQALASTGSVTLKNRKLWCWTMDL